MDRHNYTLTVGCGLFTAYYMYTHIGKIIIMLISFIIKCSKPLSLSLSHSLTLSLSLSLFLSPSLSPSFPCPFPFPSPSYMYMYDLLHTRGPGSQFDTVDGTMTRVSGGVEVEPECKE